jgi:hypothetical protein
VADKESDEKYSLKLLGTGVDIQNPALLKQLAEVALVPVEEVAKLSATAVRILALPFRAAEAYGERLIQTIKNAEAQVPPVRQIEPTPSIAGPILENVKHLENGSPLLAMYENLLAPPWIGTALTRHIRRFQRCWSNCRPMKLTCCS